MNPTACIWTQNRNLYVHEGVEGTYALILSFHKSGIKATEKMRMWKELCRLL